MLTQQIPISSNFEASTTTNEIIYDCYLSGKTAIVTGGHSGLGLETVRALRSEGATAPARDHAKTQAAFKCLPGVEIAAHSKEKIISSLKRSSPIIYLIVDYGGAPL